MGAPRAVIFGVGGPALTSRERQFLREADPWGFILFARNVVDPDQLRALTADLRDAVGRDAPVLVDQEGGRVARLRGPHWREWEPPLTLCERLAPGDLDAALVLRFRLIAHELRAVGIDVNCAPLLDVPAPGADPVIGGRALGQGHEAVAARGRAVRLGLETGGVLPVIKHLPGHGRADADSHEALPHVDAPLSDLREVDFAAFASHADAPLGMTAHVVFSAIDPGACATLSPLAIRLIRDDIGFGGALMTDDISMGALSGPVAARADAAWAAGCDLVLHCNGEAGEMDALAAVAPALAGGALDRCDAALAARRAPEPFDPAEADARFAALFREKTHA